MLGGNEFRLREVGGFAANFNRANRHGSSLRSLTNFPREVHSELRGRNSE